MNISIYILLYIYIYGDIFICIQTSKILKSAANATQRLAAESRGGALYDDVYESGALNPTQQVLTRLRAAPRHLAPQN